ncbi:MAG: hypothetical protein MK107_15300 [Oceanicola sp.]|nr:hypothetical protein [Oceanicola sp.]
MSKTNPEVDDVLLSVRKLIAGREAPVAAPLDGDRRLDWDTVMSEHPAVSGEETVATDSAEGTGTETVAALVLLPTQRVNTEASQTEDTPSTPPAAEPEPQSDDTEAVAQDTEQASTVTPSANEAEEDAAPDKAEPQEDALSPSNDAPLEASSDAEPLKTETVQEALAETAPAQSVDSPALAEEGSSASDAAPEDIDTDSKDTPADPDMQPETIKQAARSFGPKPRSANATNPVPSSLPSFVTAWARQSGAMPGLPEGHFEHPKALPDAEAPSPSLAADQEHVDEAIDETAAPDGRSDATEGLADETAEADTSNDRTIAPSPAAPYAATSGNVPARTTGTASTVATADPAETRPAAPPAEEALVDQLADAVRHQIAEALPAQMEELRPQLLDEDALRPLVADLIRKELSGDLGERITGSVRKLVRQEIQRAITVRRLE